MFYRLLYANLLLARILTLQAEHSQRLISSLIVENIFGAAKARVAKGSSKQCTAAVHGVLPSIPGALAQKARFTEISRATVLSTRNSTMPDYVCHPPYAPKHMVAADRELNLHSVVGNGEADWWSPTAIRVAVPIIDMIVARNGVKD